MSAKTVFMFSGQGSQFYQMGKQLFDTHPVFKEWMLRLDAQVKNSAGYSVVEAIYAGGKAEVFAQTAFTHPAIFIVEYALAQTLIAEGIRPDLTLGASLGSFAAASVAGCISPELALNAVLEQAASFPESCERGGMISIVASPDLYQEAFLQQRSELAGINFHSHFVVSGLDPNLDAIEKELKERNITYQRLGVEYAYHSQWIEGAEEQYDWFLRGLSCKPAQIPVVCCAQAKSLATLPGDFFWQVVRTPIRFRDAIMHLQDKGTYRYLDVGPSGTLATFVKYLIGKDAASTAYPLLTPYGQDQKNLAAVLAAFA